MRNIAAVATAIVVSLAVWYALGSAALIYSPFGEMLRAHEQASAAGDASSAMAEKYPDALERLHHQLVLQHFVVVPIAAIAAGLVVGFLGSARIATLAAIAVIPLVLLHIPSFLVWGKWTVVSGASYVLLAILAAYLVRRLRAVAATRRTG